MSFWKKFFHEDESTFPNVDTSCLMFVRYMGNEFGVAYWDADREEFVLDSRPPFEPWLITHYAEIPADYAGTLPPQETAEMSDELFPTPPPRKEKCRRCKHWAMAKNPWGYGFGVCTIRSTKRNQFGFERRSANSAACHLYKTEEQETESKK